MVSLLVRRQLKRVRMISNTLGRRFLQNWQRSELDDKQTELAKILFNRLLLIAALETTQNAQQLVQSDQSLLTGASDTMTSLKGGNSTSTGISGLLTSLTSQSSTTSAAPSADAGLGGLFGAVTSLLSAPSSAASPSGSGSLLSSLMGLATESSTTDSNEGILQLLTKDNLQSNCFSF